ncbi:MAG: hypothetical protein EOP49_40700 [Sphingobacteriales bacterium]|nr:MAG: hypothetical protein EOP49_40700 [Sphingobacteriales bacterium]
MADFFDDMQAYFKLHPQTMALVPLVFGVVMLAGAWFNWNWLYSPNGTFRGVGGIGAVFGRTAARIAGCVIAIIFFGVAIFMFQVKKW